MKRWRSLSVLLLALTAIYLYAFPTATIAYAITVLFHTGLGVLLTIGLVLFLFRGLAGKNNGCARLGWLLLIPGAVLGIALIYLGTPHRLKAWLYTHIALCTLAVVFLAAAWLKDRGWLGTGSLQRAFAFVAVLLAIVGIAAGAWWVRNVAWNNAYRVTNPAIAPATMDDEGDGAKGKFFPSSAQTTDGKNIPAEYFLQSEACERCHSDIYKQWESSSHHFSSFNNQWYRKSIEYMQEVNGVKQSKWCAGCHDPALLFSGLMDTPDQADRQSCPKRAQA